VQDEQVTDTIHHARAEKHLLPREHLLDRGYVTTALSTYSHRSEHRIERWEVCASLCPQAAMAGTVISRQIWNLFASS
jgi:hypothetical protein